MNNEWAEPEGIVEEPTYRVLYKIRESDGKVHTHRTQHRKDVITGTFYMELAGTDQYFADGINKLIQEACQYFYEDDWKPMEGVPDIVISDEEVRERIRRISLGENVREARRTSRKHYPLDDLPFEQQRALIERIEKYKQEWAFEIIGTEEIPEKERGKYTPGYPFTQVYP